MAPTNSYGQEMVSIYLIKIKITTKFFKLPCVSYRSFETFEVFDSDFGTVSMR